MHMSITDLVLLFTLLVFVGLGAKDGFIHTLGRLIGAIAGFMLAQSWSSWLSSLLAAFMPIGWARIIAFTIIFGLIIRLSGWVLTVVDNIFKFLTVLPFLKSVDRLLGALVGFAEAIIVLGGIIYLATTFKPVASLYALLSASGVAKWIGGVFHALLGILLK